MIASINMLISLAALCWAQSFPADVTLPAERLSGLPEILMINSVRAELRAPKLVIPVGSPVIIEFTLQNVSDEPVKLNVPGALGHCIRVLVLLNTERPQSEMRFVYINGAEALRITTPPPIA